MTDPKGNTFTYKYDANANPTMNSDPTGYFSLSEMNVSMKIQGVLAKISQPRVKF